MKKVLKLLQQFYFIYFKGRVAYARSIGVKVGSDCRLYINDFGTEPFLIEIGNKVTITSGVKIITHDGATWLINDKNARRFSYKKVIIGNHIFIGINSIILPGTLIEDNVIVAAGSVVTKSIPTGVVVAGNPAKIIGSFEHYQQKAIQNFKSKRDWNNQKKFKENVLNLLDHEAKPFLKKPIA